MLVEDTLILAWSLVNGVTITQDWCPSEVHYYQIEMEAHDCVIAEGAWSETYADCGGLREQFHNAAEFYALYPDHRPPEELSLCAQRPERGAKLDAALRPVIARTSGRLHPGPLGGSIDRVALPWKIEGWAQDEDHPELPVLLELLLDGRVIGTVLACDFREDLLQAGIGRGRCSFSFSSPVRITPHAASTVQIRRAVDGAGLRMTTDCQAGIDALTLTPPPARLRLVG
jgi:hypothetical protein